MKPLRPILALALLALVAEMPCARAAEPERAGETAALELPAEAEAHARGGVSVDEAVAMVEKRFKARVVRVETKREGDQTVYVLRVLKDSRVWTVRVDAETGAIH